MNYESIKNKLKNYKLIKNELKIDHESWMNIYMNEFDSSCESVICNNSYNNLVALSLGNFQIANLITSFSSITFNSQFQMKNATSFLISTH